jgi:hypothetical protein
MVSTPDAIEAAFDAGINFFFLSADLHWPLYEASRQGLARLFAREDDVRSRVVVAVASYVTQPEFPVGALSEVVAAVPRLQGIDLAVIGGAYGHDFLDRLDLFQELSRARTLGIRAVGATFHDRRAALAATNAGLVDLTFVRYNPSHPGARHDLFPRFLDDRKVPVYGFTSVWGHVPPARFAGLGLGRDYWRPAVTDYHRFALTAKGIDGLLCAPQTPDEVRGLERALDDGPLTAEESQYLIDLASVAEGRSQLASDRAARPRRRSPR